MNGGNRRYLLERVDDAAVVQLYPDVFAAGPYRNLTIEEARADLVALYFLTDPSLVEIGVLDRAQQEEVVHAEYEHYTRYPRDLETQMLEYSASGRHDVLAPTAVEH